MSRRRLASLLLAGTTFLAVAACTTGAGGPTSGASAGEPAATLAKPRPVHPAELIAEGDRLAASGDLYAAVDSYMAARRADPAQLDAAARLGLTLAEQGRHAEALPHLKDAHRAKADDVAVTRALVNALLALERPAEAAAKLKPVLAQHPEDARLWNASGIAADMMGDSEAAATAYRSGLAAAPDNLSLKVNLALSRYASGDAEGASMAAAAAGLSMAEVQARANRLAAYRNRTAARSAGAVPAALGPVPEAPPMVALALPPVGVQELPPVAVAPPSPPAAPVAIAESPKPAEPMPNSLPTETAPLPPAGEPPSAASAPSDPAPQEAAAQGSAVAPEPGPADATPAPLVLAAAPPSPPVAAMAAPATGATEDAKPATSSWHAGKPQVQLAAYGRAAQAEAQWAKLKAEHPSLLEGLEPVIQKAELGADRGVVYRLRVAVSDKAAGAALCERLHGAGLDCVPVPAL
jgi:Flp pilus assembly protein TadD